MVLLRTAVKPGLSRCVVKRKRNYLLVSVEDKLTLNLIVFHCVYGKTLGVPGIILNSVFCSCQAQRRKGAGKRRG